MNHDFLKVISHLLLDKTHLIIAHQMLLLVKILVEKAAVFSWLKKGQLLEFPLYTTKYKPSGTLSNSDQLTHRSPWHTIVIIEMIHFLYN